MSTDHHRHDAEPADPRAAFLYGAAAAHGPRSNPEVLRRFTSRLPPLRFEPYGRFVGHVVSALDSMMDSVFAHGWQPAELVHAVKRDAGARPTRLLLELLCSHSGRTSAHTAAPAGWQDQLRELGITPSWTRTERRLSNWRAAEGATDLDAWNAVFTLAGVVNQIGALPIIGPIPTQWGDDSAPTTSIRSSDPKMLSRIRGLLAKAEATSFPAEAETFSAKAQELMTRYAIDSAVLDDAALASPNEGVVTRRLLVDNPYPEAKVRLLHAVSEANGAKVVWHKRPGLVSVIGMPVDLDLCELLFTSLLVQSASALREPGSAHTTRVASFRRSFLLAYAGRIRERLIAVHVQARREATEQYGRELVPLLARRDEAVEHAVNEMFPACESVSFSSSNSAGWYAGRRAADTADLTGGRSSLPDDPR